MSEKGDFNIEEALDYYEESCNAIQNITDFFKFGKQINQIKNRQPTIFTKNNLTNFSLWMTILITQSG